MIIVTKCKNIVTKPETHAVEELAKKTRDENDFLALAAIGGLGLFGGGLIGHKIKKPEKAVAQAQP